MGLFDVLRPPDERPRTAAEAGLDAHRITFIRWLIEQGRLNDGPDLSELEDLPVLQPPPDVNARAWRVA